MRLVERQSFLRCEAEILRFSIKAVYGAQRLQHIPAFAGETLCNFRKLPPPVSEAVGQQGFNQLR